MFPYTESGLLFIDFLHLQFLPFVGLKLICLILAYKRSLFSVQGDLTTEIHTDKNRSCVINSLQKALEIYPKMCSCSIPRECPLAPEAKSVKAIYLGQEKWQYQKTLWKQQSCQSSVHHMCKRSLRGIFMYLNT